MDDENLPFFVDRAKGGRANCKGCKDKCPSGELRIAKVTPSPYGDDKKMKNWYHVDCLMTAFIKQRPTTKRIDGPDEIGNWSKISSEDQELILEKLKDMELLCVEKYGTKAMMKPKQETKHVAKPSTSRDEPIQNSKTECLFRDFRKICSEIITHDAYTAKTAVVNNLFTKGIHAEGFKGDMKMWCRLLLPGAIKRIYNLKSKQLVKLFSRIFNNNHEDMLADLEDGDVAETIFKFFKKSTHCIPAKQSSLTLKEVDQFLEHLTKLTKEDEQTYHFKTIVNKCTANDLKMIIRLVKGDLRINAGPKHILEGIHVDAYKIFQSSKDIDNVIDRVTKQSDETAISIKASVKAGLVLMTPFYPMLAEACKSVEMAIKKCPNGMFSEIKYDGERVQIHKQGSEFKYFSRSLKPVTQHKIARLKDFIPKAFPYAQELILDSEILMVDTKTGEPLPFGSLGVHKRTEFTNAEVCLYIFDCMYYNGENLMEKPLKERRKILEKNIKTIKNHVQLSEFEVIEKASDLANSIAKALKLGLEGLVLKDLKSKYEPGKRHWIKVKKDYLFDGKMADSTDLVVLGAWFGTGKKGGMLSVFLMGCYDEYKKKWVTVTKVHTGHDDKQLDSLQEPFRESMERMSKDSHPPSWFSCDKKMIPDFLAKDPKAMPVWEITGAEFTKANVHTADGISVRFPRVTRIRDDKTWSTATSLKELKVLYQNSKDHVDVSLLNNLANISDDVEDTKGAKKKLSKSPKKMKMEVDESVDSKLTKTEFDKSDSPKKKCEITNMDKKASRQDMPNDDPNESSRSSAKRKGTLIDSLKESNQLTMVPRYSDGMPVCKKQCLVRENNPISDGEMVVISNLLSYMMDSDGAHKNMLDANSSYSHLPSANTEKSSVTSHLDGLTLAFYDKGSEIDESMKDYVRQWKDCSGTFDGSKEKSNATHVVHFSKSLTLKDLKQSGYNFSKSARHVTLSWLENTLSYKQIANVYLHSVCLTT